MVTRPSPEPFLNAEIPLECDFHDCVIPLFTSHARFGRRQLWVNKVFE